MVRGRSCLDSIRCNVRCDARRYARKNNSMTVHRMYDECVVRVADWWTRGGALSERGWSAREEGGL